MGTKSDTVLACLVQQDINVWMILTALECQILVILVIIAKRGQLEPCAQWVLGNLIPERPLKPIVYAAQQGMSATQKA